MVIQNLSSIKEYEVKYEVFIPYHKAAIKLPNRLEKFHIDNALRHGNVYVDALV